MGSVIQSLRFLGKNWKLTAISVLSLSITIALAVVLSFSNTFLIPPPLIPPPAGVEPKRLAGASLALPPRITQLFTVDQRNELNRSYGEFLSLAARDLETLSKRRLSANQTSQVEHIRAFKRQAEDQFKHDDLVTAVELARRTFLLAEDLVSRAR